LKIPLTKVTPSARETIMIFIFYLCFFET